MTTHYSRITVKEFSAPGWNTHSHAEVHSPNSGHIVRQPRWDAAEAWADAYATVGLPLRVADTTTVAWRGGTQTITTLVPNVDLICEARYQREGWTITVSLMRDAKGMWLVGEFGNDRELMHGRSREGRQPQVAMFGTEDEARDHARQRHYAVTGAGFRRQRDAVAA